MLNHPVFALFHRRLILEMRSGVTHIFRLAWLALTLLAIFGTAEEAGRMAAPGLFLHNCLLVVNFVLICLLGTGIFAKTITEEKEDRTLGLLRMTSLSSVSILLGKATGAMLCLALLLVAQLPFALLSVTLGGISWEQVFAGYAAILGFFLLQANLGLLWSAQCRTGRGAAVMTVLSLALLFLPPWFLYMGMWQGASVAGELVLLKVIAFFQSFSPFYRAYITTQGFDGQIVSIQVLTNLGMSLLFFLLAWWRFAAMGYERPSGNSRLRQISDAVKSRCERGRRAWKPAVLWHSFHFVGGGRVSFGLRVLVVIVAIAASLWHSFFYWPAMHVSIRLDTIGAFMLSTSLIALFLEAAWSLSRLFGIDRQEDCWASIYASPLSLGHIVGQKVLGWLLALSPWILLFVVGFALSGELGSFLNYGWHDDDTWFGCGLCTLSLLMIVYFSLYPRRAPVIMTAAILFVGNIVMFNLLDIMNIRNEKIWIVSAPFGASAWLIYAIRRRLIALAAE